MQVAVSICSNHFVVRAQAERCFRGLSGCKVFDLAAGFGFQGDPFDIMRIDHRMGNRPDFDLHGAAAFLYDWDLLFDWGAGRTGKHLRDLLAAANDRYPFILHKGNHIPAMFTNEKFHDDSSFKLTIIARNGLSPS